MTYYVLSPLNRFATRKFVRESNEIEGIIREPKKHEVAATFEFLSKIKIDVSDLVDLVAILQPGALLRDTIGLNVYVGGYRAPDGHPSIAVGLKQLLKSNELNSFEVHCKYEKLHPFTDGNGRSGRALWAWHMISNDKNPFDIEFLHHFYYQTLRHYK